MPALCSRKIFVVYLMIVLASCLIGVGPAEAAWTLKPKGPLSFKLEKLAANPNALADEIKLSKSRDRLSYRPDALILDADNRILVYIRVDDAGADHIAALKKAGAAVTHVSTRYKTITALVAATDLKSLSNLSFVRRIDEVVRPWRRQIDCVGATTSEGDSQLKADAARARHGVDGSGVIVGVLSDSFAVTTDPAGLDDDIGTGDLPGAGNPCGRADPITIVQDDYLSNQDEGRAMAQIVHDLAPGAKLAFATALPGIFQFADNIRRLRNEAKADIIVDDICYPDEPFFQDGPAAVAIKDVVADGAPFFTSAGNDNNVAENGENVSSHEAPAYRPTACPTLYYQGEANTDMGADCHNFDPAGDTPYQELVLEDQSLVNLVLDWAEPWYGVSTDLDVYLTDTSHNIMAFGAARNTGSSGTQKPYENLFHINTTGTRQTVRIYITRWVGADRPRLKYIIDLSGKIVAALFSAANSTDIFGPSISGHAGSADALSIAAVPYNNPDAPEPFTAHGDFTVYLGPVSDSTPAEVLPEPQVRHKPDLAASDGVANTFFGHDDNGVWRFFGTSAAAPHAAAVAALMVEKNRREGRPDLTQADVEKFMKGSATPIPGGGPTITGAGLLDAAAAIDQMLSPNPGPPATGEKDSGVGSKLGCFTKSLY
ncbi:MAG: S8 family serine peptidase [Pseudomonadota bacterium]